MCGITGFVDFKADKDSLALSLEKMLLKIEHRGPDSQGMWIDQGLGLALGHRRLAIIDLTSAGAQPMESKDGRYVIVFNGEIYNHLEIRKQIENTSNDEAMSWVGHSDTETLLAAFSKFGIEKTLKLSIGMFALALWDKKEKQLTLARDRLGEKPLYYGFQNGVLLFGSELKAIKAHDKFSENINWDSAASFLRLNYIPAPHSIYLGINKLVQGTFLQISLEDIQVQKFKKANVYWSLEKVSQLGLDKPFRGSFEDATSELSTLIRKAVQLQLISDVPLGAFLSGGVDSSLVVAMMRHSSNVKISTFSIGMPEESFDESGYALAVARHLGTQHNSYQISAKDIAEIVPKINETWDEPFGDSSQLPTYLVCKLARKQVTVALSGDGGDEFFLGYKHYAFNQNLWQARYLGYLPWETSISIVSPFLKSEQFNKKIRNAKSLVSAWRQKNNQMFHRYWTNRYRNGNFPLKGEFKDIETLNIPILEEAASSAALWDAGTYLPDDVLVKVDRAAMANSLETRAPLLDHRLIEFALTLPLKYKLDGGVNKKVLREVLYKYVPKELVDRPKMGFSVPISKMLKHELRPWAESLLLKVPNYSDRLDEEIITKMWNQHINGAADHSEKLWTLLTFLGFLK